MKKKIIVTIGAAVLTLGIATTSFAAIPVESSGGYGFCGGGYGLMWDQDGSFLDKDAFEEKLDKLIEDGYISSEDRDYFLERYDLCSDNGGGSFRGGCGGRGMAFRNYR